MRNISVLLADDEIAILQGIKKIYDWEENGFDIIGTASDGITVLNMALEKKPDIVILDINMPLMSGLDVAGRIIECLPDTLVMIVSGYSDAHYMRRAIQYKVFDYIFKPICIEDFSAALNKAQIQILNHMGDAEQLKESKNRTTIQEMVNYLNEHIAEDISLKMLAEYFHMNSSYVSQYFKKETGMNYSTYVSRLRIQKAETLLRTTERSVTEIAEQTGFHDYRFFSRTFKQVTGITPSQYRAENTI